MIKAEKVEPRVIGWQEIRAVPYLELQAKDMNRSVLTNSFGERPYAILVTGGNGLHRKFRHDLWIEFNKFARELLPLKPRANLSVVINEYEDGTTALKVALSYEKIKPGESQNA